MTRDEMHTAFRVYGQQVGMQKMRNILPEEIDIFLNSAVVEKIRQVLGTNVVAQFPDKVSTQQNSISPINYVRTLLKYLVINGTHIKPDAYRGTYDESQVMYVIGCEVLYSLGDKSKHITCRFIEPTEYYMTVNDFCNAPSLEYPIFTIDDSNIIFVNGVSDSSQVSLKIIKYPKRIEKNSNCDLPEYTHDEIVQLAVQKYFASLNNTQKVN